MDIHEKDTEYMAKCYEAALYSCRALGWEQIKCYEGDKIRTIDDISKQIYDEVSRL
jgi:dTMP kinase